MSVGDVIGFIVVPLGVFLLTAAGAGIVTLVKITSYFAASKAAQESTALSNSEIVKRLDTYIGSTDTRLTDHGERISVLEYANEVAKRAKQDSQ